ncbi:MAG: hypothetical protein ACTSO4_14980 [Promethearchaeota archaeon]
MTIKSHRFIKWIFNSIEILILVSSILLLSLNLDFFTVIHAKASEFLPVLKEETYTTVQVSIFYIIITLSSAYLMFNNLSKFDVLKRKVSFLILIISSIVLIIEFFNPHSIIINPTGFPPTSLKTVHLGLFSSLIMLGLKIIISLRVLIMEKISKKSKILILLFILGALSSDFIHEMGHVFFIILTGGKVIEFYPFPILLGGEFNAGYVNFIGVPKQFLPLVLLGGEIFQWISIIIILITLYLNKNVSTWIKYYLEILLFFAWLDFPLYTINNFFGLPHWFLIGSSNGDIILFSNLIGLPILIFIILALTQLCIGIILLIKIIKMKKRKNDSKINENL